MNTMLFTFLSLLAIPQGNSYEEIRAALPISRVAIEFLPQDPEQVVPYERVVRSLTIWTSVAKQEVRFPLEIYRWKADWYYTDPQIPALYGVRIVFSRRGDAVYLQVFDTAMVQTVYVKLTITQQCPEDAHCTLIAQ